MARVQCLCGGSGVGRARRRRLGRALPSAALLALAFVGTAMAGEWRVGDRDQPWLLAPVSFRMDRGWLYKPDFFLGGSWSCEMVVDDDGDGAIDEDGVDIVDNDGDFLFNEDKPDGLDNDGDGLIDEDATQPVYGLPATWDRWVFAYDPALLPEAQRPTTSWFLRPGGQQYYAATVAAGDTTPVLGTDGQPLVAGRTRRSFSPVDFVRPARMDSTRSVFHFVHDQYLAGMYAQSPFDAQSWGATQPMVYEGTSGYGQIVDGNLYTARIQDQANASAGFRGELRGKYLINRIRFRPRPAFPDRTLHSFYVMYANDTPTHYRETYADGEYSKNMVVSAWMFDAVKEWYSPAVKDLQLNGGRYGSPKEARIIDIRGQMKPGEAWEFAEVELYASGYAMDANYVSEVIDVGTARPQYRRYFDPADPTRRTLIEKVTTVDVNKNSTIEPSETTRSILNSQFRMDAPGTSVTWGRVSWSGKREGKGGNVQIRMRAGTTPDPYVYVRRLGKGVYSQYVESAIALDWPKRGDTIDAFIYATMSGTERANGYVLPYNSMGETDGAPGGWSFWSVPFNFEDGLVDANGEGGVVMPLPPLTRYVQFMVDFLVPADASSGVALDWINFEFFDPYVRGGVLSEVYVDSLTTDGGEVPLVLGTPFPFRYVMKPSFESRQDPGFNRIDLAVPTLAAQLDEFLVDGLAWTRIVPEVPAGLSAAAAAAYRDSLAHSQQWLDQVTVTQPRTYAMATYLDARTKAVTLSIKTPRLGYDQFPAGQGRDIEMRLRTPLYRLLTDFASWIRDDALDAAIVQATTAGNASDQLPMDKTTVTAQESGKALEVAAAAPNPFSPNGDGINDQITFSARLFLLTEAVDVRVDLYDLAGRRVRRLGPQSVTAGNLTLIWDGRDEAGNTVPPGVYAYMLIADSDTEQSKVRTGTIGVAY